MVTFAGFKTTEFPADKAAQSPAAAMIMDSSKRNNDTDNTDWFTSNKAMVLCWRIVICQWFAKTARR
jgi:hypothetical protein